MDREYQLLDRMIVILNHNKASNSSFASIPGVLEGSRAGGGTGASRFRGTGGCCRSAHHLASLGRFGPDVKLGGREGESADRGVAQSAHVGRQLEIRSRDDGSPNSFGNCESDSSRLWERDGKGLVRHISGCPFEQSTQPERYLGFYISPKKKLIVPEIIVNECINTMMLQTSPSLTGWPHDGSLLIHQAQAAVQTCDFSLSTS